MRSTLAIHYKGMSARGASSASLACWPRFLDALETAHDEWQARMGNGVVITFKQDPSLAQRPVTNHPLLLFSSPPLPFVSDNC